VEEERALRCLFDLDEVELLEVGIGIGREETLAVSSDRWRHHQSQLVDEPSCNQRPGKFSAAVDTDVAVRLLLQASHVIGDRWRDSDRVLPVPREMLEDATCLRVVLMNDANGSTSDVGQ
jgi:hypothetical protein